MANRLFLGRRLAAALLAATALTHPFAARAQQTRSALQNLNNSSITTNGRGSITGASLNNLFNQILTSVLFGGDPADTLTVGGQTLSTKLANVHSILESGAACNGVSNPSNDDTSALTAWFATLAPGTIVYFPAGAFCSILSANVILPNGVRFIGATNVGYVNTGADPSGSGLLEEPPYHIIATTNIIDGIGVWRSTVDGHYHIAPTGTQAKADVAQWWNEWSVGIETQAPTTLMHTQLRSVPIFGFHIGLLGNSGFVDWYNIKGDCTTLIAQMGGGDESFGDTARDEPFYSGRITQANGAWQRYGSAFFIGSTLGGGANGANWSHLQAEGWPKFLTLENVGDTYMNQIGGEYPASWNNSPVGYPSEKYGVGIQTIASGAPFNLQNLDLKSGGSDGLFAGGIFNEATSIGVKYSDPLIASIATGGIGFYASGQTATPTTVTVNSVPSVGSTIVVTFSGSSVTAVSGPYSISYAVQAGDTVGLIAQRLSYLIDTQYSALGFAHVVSTQSNLPAGELQISWPADATVTVAISGTGSGSVSTGSGSVLPGSSGELSGVDFSEDMGSAAYYVQLGNTMQRALAWTISNPVFDNGTVPALPTNWLYAPQSPAGPKKLFLTGVPFSYANASHISGGGTGAYFLNNSRDDSAVLFTGTGSPTSFTYTFTTQWPWQPICLPVGPITSYGYSATSITLNFAAAAANTIFGWQCQLQATN